MIVRATRDLSTPPLSTIVTVPLLDTVQQALFRNLTHEVGVDYLNSKSSDNDFIVVDGAMTIAACTNCAKPRRTAPSARKNFFEHAVKSISDSSQAPSIPEAPSQYERLTPWTPLLSFKLIRGEIDALSRQFHQGLF
jgi:hypothetical protein